VIGRSEPPLAAPAHRHTRRVTRMRQVELVENGEPDDDLAEPEVAAARRVRLRRWWWVPLVVAGLALGAQQGVDAYQRHTAARYAGVPGVLAPIQAPLTVRWTIRDTLHWSWRPIDADHVAAAGSIDGVAQGVSVDVRTGRYAWRTALPQPAGDGGRCEPVTPGPGDGPGRGTPQQVVCLTGDTVETPDGAAPDPGPAHLTVLDAATGHRLHEFATTAAQGFDVGDDVAVLAIGRGDGRDDVRAIDLRTGTVRWSTTTPVSRSQQAQAAAVVVVAGGEALVFDTGGVSRLALADGTVLSPPQPVLALSLSADRSRAQLTTRTGYSPLTVVVGGPGGDVTLPGLDRSPVADDGSLDGLMLTQVGDKLTAYGSTGKVTWTAPETVSATVVLGGVVYGSTGTGAVALDGRTGHVRWRADVGPSTAAQLLTDGFHLLLDVGATGADPLDNPRREIVALDKAHGTVVWRSPYPAGSGSYVRPFGHALLGFGDTSTGIG
jgi:outer membrane protein assembly factor BamB